MHVEVHLSDNFFQNRLTIDLGQLFQKFYLLLAKLKLVYNLKYRFYHPFYKLVLLLDMGYTGPQKTIFIAQTSNPKNML